MRLFEVADRFVNDLETILRNLVGRSDSKGVSQTLSWPALAHILQNLGYGGLTFDQFAKVYDENPGLQPLVRNYDENGIQLGTKEAPAGGDEEPMDIPTGPSVDQMASSGVNAHYKDING